MSRGVSGAMGTALAGAVSNPALLATFEFASGAVSLWSGQGNLTWNLETFTGVGSLVSVEYPEESGAGAARGATFTLSGIDGSWNALALLENYQGRPCSLWYAELDGAGEAIVDPILIFPGIMNQMTLRDDGATSTVSLEVEREALDNRPSNRLYDNETQQRLHAGDKGFEFLARIQEVPINWGVPGAGGLAYSPGAGRQTRNVTAAHR